MNARMVWIAVLMLAGAGMAVSAPAQDQQKRLVDAKAQSAAAAARSAALDRKASGELDQAAKARQQEAAVAARIQQAEADIAAGQARIDIIARMMRRQRARLDEQQGPIVRLVAALQALARRPAMLSVVRPGSLQDIVHVRAVLASTLPVIRDRTRDVRADLARTRQLQADAATATRALGEARQRMETQRLALTRLEAEHRLRSQSLGRTALFESDRAIAMGERARDIVDLMDRMGDQAGIRDGLASLPGPSPRPLRPGEVASPVETTSWSRAAPPYRLPAMGRVVVGLGEVSEAGVRSRGVTIAAARKSVVVAPAAGRVAYAAPFRGYGTIVILDHGDGWTSLVSGLGLISARVGQRIEQGQPIGRALDSDDARITVELRRRGRAVDMTPLVG